MLLDHGMVDGKEVTMQVKSEIKLYIQNMPEQKLLDEEEFIIVKQSDIVAIVED